MDHFVLVSWAASMMCAAPGKGSWVTVGRPAVRNVHQMCIEVVVDEVDVTDCSHAD